MMNGRGETTTVVVVAALFVFALTRTVIRRKRQSSKIKRSYVPFAFEYPPTAVPSSELLLVVDSSHPTARQITHHLKGSKQKAAMDLSLRGDSSTDGALNAIVRNHPDFTKARFVTANHFDIDSFIPVWACINPEAAKKHERLLREVARIGDFRELRLDEPFQYDALKIACYLNSEERRLFYKPFEAAISLMDGEREAVGKFEHFLGVFGSVIENPDAFTKAWKEEYDRVVEDYELVNKSPLMVHPESDMIVLALSRPVHYYALFSRSRGFDIVVTLYPQRRYEVEVKYTTMVDLASRPCLPRVDMTFLAKHLNTLESNRSARFAESFHWKADRFVDSGPMLRIDSKERGNLAKSERYAHPYEREVYSSCLDPNDFQLLVSSFFAFGLTNATRKKDWEWEELSSINQTIDWPQWVATSLPLHLKN